MLLWKNLQELADFGEITICETVVTECYKNRDGSIQRQVHLTTLTRFESYDYESLITYNCDKNPRSWKWNEIKDYFRELNIEEVALLNGDELNYHTEKDIPLFEACNELDFEKIKQAVANGANVNAIDKNGDTPICNVLDFVEDYEDDFLIEILDYLIEKGADINLFGFGGSDCLTNAHFSNKPRLMEYLFEHGARKDLNCFVTDLYDNGQWNILNAAYDYCITDRAMGDYYDDNCKEQIDILEKNGVKFYIDDRDCSEYVNLLDFCLYYYYEVNLWSNGNYFTSSF